MPGHLFIYLFIYFKCSSIQFFNSLTCDLPETMPRQRSLPLLPREEEDFPRGDRYFKHVPPLTYLIYLSPKELYSLSLFKRYSYLTVKYNSSMRFELFLRWVSLLEDRCFIHLATELYDQG